MSVTVSRNRNGIHKFMAVFPDGYKVHFGRQGYSDYTKHKDKERMERYLTRHRRRENWTRSGARRRGSGPGGSCGPAPPFQAPSLKLPKFLEKKSY